MKKPFFAFIIYRLVKIKKVYSDNEFVTFIIIYVLCAIKNHSK